MKIAVVYSSLSGNTEKLAKGVYERISNSHEKSIFNAKDMPNLDEFDIVALGFWVDRSYPNKEIKELISTLNNKKVFFFGTMGFFPDSKHGRDCIENTLGLFNDSNTILGYFICNGKIDMKVLERMANMKAANPTEEAMKAHAIDEKNMIRYRILGEHVNNLDIEYCSSLLNERILIEEKLLEL